VWTIYTVLFLASISFFVIKVIYAITHPSVYDFTAFFLWGKTAAEGYNFYLPQNLQSVFASLRLPPLDYHMFSEEIVSVGFFYPPPTILYFVPLGFLSYETAIICWAIFNMLFGLGSIYLLYDLFFRKEKLNGLMFVTILFVFFKPVADTITFLQTNFIVFFYLLLIRKYWDKKMSGVFVALAMFTKPYMAILILLFIIRKKWGAILYFLAAACLMTGVTLLIFGPAPFQSYLFNNPIRRMPEWVYGSLNNQSVHGVFLRLGLITLGSSFAYIVVILVIALLSALYIRFLATRRLYDYMLAFLLLIGLLIYPGTLSYYGVVLLFIIFQFFNRTNQLGLKDPFLTTIIVAVFYWLTTFSIFLAICFLLFIIVFESIRTDFGGQQKKIGGGFGNRFLMIKKWKN
jgi:hypothetical protein